MLPFPTPAPGRAPALFLLLLSTTVTAAPAAPPAPLTLLKAYPDAVCMDGSPGGYYHQPATAAADRDKWVIHLEGGGECNDETTCKKKMSTALGSSTKFHPEFQPYQLASSDPDESPVMYSWNHVFVPYCSQDIHSGQSPEPNEWGVRFAGHRIVEAIVSDLMTNSSSSGGGGGGSGNTNTNTSTNTRADELGLAAASTVVLSGGSAGGIGTWINVEWLAAQLPKETLVIAAPIAGYYFYAYPYDGPGHTSSGLGDFRVPAWPGHVKLWHSFVPTACATALAADPVRAAGCLLSNNSAAYVTVPIFVTEAQSDYVQLLYHDWVPPGPASKVSNASAPSPVKTYMEEWKANQTLGMRANLKPDDGWFNPACYIHTEFTHKAPLIGGVSYVVAFNSWLASTQRRHAQRLIRQTGTSEDRQDDDDDDDDDVDKGLAEGAAKSATIPPRLMDDCGLLCNKQCH